MTFNLRRFLQGFVMLLPFIYLSGFAPRVGVNGLPNPYKTDIWSIEQTPTPHPTSTPLPTQIVNIPLVRQDGNLFIAVQNQEVTTTPEDTETPTPTLTPPYIPPQDVSTNLPIVFGAMAIVIVVVGAWFFVSRQELKALQDE